MINTPRVASRRSKVLIVEDEVLLAWDIEDALRSGGYDVAGAATSVDAALDMISAKKIDLAILDVNLNGHLSLPLIYELKRRGIPFVVCTAYANLLDAKEPALSGVPILAKPMRSEALVEELGRLVQGSGKQAPVASISAAPPLQSEIARLFSRD